MYKKITNGLIALSFLIGFYAYNVLPEKIVSHWDMYGNPNGYMPKFWGAFLMPIIGLALYILFLVLYKADPLQENIKKFHQKFELFVAVLIGFLLYLDILTILWNVDYKFNFVVAMVPSFALLLYFVGDLVQHSKRNWMIGIRTPWSMQNDEIWDKTNQLAGKMFKTSAIISLAGIFAQNYAFYITISTVLISAIYPVFYSYRLYKKNK